MTYEALNGLAPQYLTDILVNYDPSYLFPKVFYQYLE